MKEILIGDLIVLAIVSITYLLAKDRAKRIKLVIWGALTMFPLSLVLAFVIGMNYSYFDNSSMGFVMAVYLFPLFLVIGFITFGIGITKIIKKKRNEKE